MVHLLYQKNYKADRSVKVIMATYELTRHAHRERPLMTSDDFWRFLTYIVTMSNDFYLIKFNFGGSFWTFLPILKSDVINGRSSIAFFPDYTGTKCSLKEHSLRFHSLFMAHKWNLCLKNGHIQHRGLKLDGAIGDFAEPLWRQKTGHFTT